MAYNQQVFNQFEHQVVRLSIKTLTSTKNEFLGTGIIAYNFEGVCLIMSCEHCLPLEGLGENQTYHIEFSKSAFKGCDAYLLDSDKQRDLALFQVDGMDTGVEPVSFVETDTEITTNTEVVLLAYYKMHDAVIEEPGAMNGRIVGPPVYFTEKQKCIRSNYTAKRGASGGPVILPTVMAVAGLNVEGEEAASYAISTETIKDAIWDWITKQGKQLEDKTVPILTMLSELLRTETGCQITNEGEPEENVEAALKP